MPSSQIFEQKPTTPPIKEATLKARPKSSGILKDQGKSARRSKRTSFKNNHPVRHCHKKPDSPHEGKAHIYPAAHTESTGKITQSQIFSPRDPSSTGPDNLPRVLAQMTGNGAKSSADDGRRGGDRGRFLKSSEQ
jgi:hypothetical protein